MVGRKQARGEMLHELEELQNGLARDWLDQSLPKDWHGLDTWHGAVRDKTRVTLRLDADMVRWFRKLGPGYQARINQVLRIYWTALLCGHISGHQYDNTLPRLMLEAQRIQREVSG
ncbi:BrnA antitoxin family protein [Tropicibacter sp. Alg240-R139]|uniref:BrnA antitoxin family protein n=1 Tax=Tropicibacter sp. Alg240-R139 TaxID=2305991 RepID=UPI001F08702D|nr:BrnA antitoxin family protein [Tropicibacter sp. Alg240-R139]